MKYHLKTKKGKKKKKEPFSIEIVDGKLPDPFVRFVRAEYKKRERGREREVRKK